VLWLSEGALGPDEHAFVVEAIEALREPSAPPHRECDLQDNGGAVFLAVRSPRGDLVGLVMILVDAKALQGLGARIVTPHVRTILQSMAILLRPPGLTTVSQRLPTLESAASASPAPPPSAAPVRSFALALQDSNSLQNHRTLCDPGQPGRVRFHNRWKYPHSCRQKPDYMAVTDIHLCFVRADR